MMWVTAPVSVREWHVGARFGTMWALAFLAAPISQLIVGGTIGETDWRSGWRSLGTVVLIAMGIASLLARRAPEAYGAVPLGKPAPADGFDHEWRFREIATSNAFWALLIALVASTLAEFVIWARTERRETIAFLSLFTVPFAGLAGDYLVRRMGQEPEARKAMLVVGPAFGALACLLFVFTGDRAVFMIAASVSFALYWSVQVSGAIGYWGSMFGRRALGRIWGLAALLAIGIAPAVGAFYGNYLPDRTGTYDTGILWALGGFLTSAVAAATLPRAAQPEFEPQTSGA
jgi:hypothetical protein